MAKDNRVDYITERNRILLALRVQVDLHRGCPAGDGEMIRSDVRNISNLINELQTLTRNYFMYGSK